MDNLSSIGQWSDWPVLFSTLERFANVTEPVRRSLNFLPWTWILIGTATLLTLKVAVQMARFLTMQPASQPSRQPISSAMLVESFKKVDVLQNRNELTKIVLLVSACLLDIPPTSKYSLMIEDLRKRLPPPNEVEESLTNIGAIERTLCEIQLQSPGHSQENNSLKQQTLEKIEKTVKAVHKLFENGQIMTYHLLVENLRSDHLYLRKQVTVEVNDLLRFLKGADEWWLFKERFQSEFDRLFHVHSFSAVLPQFKNQLQGVLSVAPNSPPKVALSQSTPASPSRVLPSSNDIGLIQLQTLQTLFDVNTYFSSSFNLHLHITAKHFTCYLQKVLNSESSEEQNRALKFYRDFSRKYIETCAESATKFSEMRIADFARTQDLYLQVQREFNTNMRAIDRVSHSV